MSACKLHQVVQWHLVCMNGTLLAADFLSLQTFTFLCQIFLQKNFPGAALSC